MMDNEDYFAEPFNRAMAWIDLLFMANYKPTTIYVRGQRVKVGIGQIAMSQEALAQRWHWSRGRVNRYLDDLEMVQQIKQQKSRLITLISITNYAKYQGNDTTDSTTNDTTIIEESKEIKNININSLSNAHTREEKEKLGFVAFGEFQNVYLKPAQRRTLDERFGEEKTQACIDDLSCRLEEGNDDNLNNSKSHYATLLHWLQYQQQRPVTSYQRELKVDLNALK